MAAIINICPKNDESIFSLKIIFCNFKIHEKYALKNIFKDTTAFKNCGYSKFKYLIQNGDLILAGDFLKNKYHTPTIP